jgi:dipeptidyl aminopeptidase/acylaminoacyl peptidase
MSMSLRLAALLLVMVASTALARPFTTDDLVKFESLGNAYLSPGGRWLIVEHTAPYDTASNYDDDGFEQYALNRLDIVDLNGSGAAEPLLPGHDGDGVNAGPFSLDGRMMAVLRLQQHRWELGLADLARRQVHWLGLTVETANWGRNVQWRSNDELVAIAMADGDQPSRINRYWASEARPAARWATATAGVRPTDTAVGSGRFLSITPKGPRAALMRINAITGAAQVLARGAFIDLEVAPGGRYVAGLGEETAHQLAPGVELRPGSTERRRGLTVVDLQSGAAVRPCGDLDLASHLLSWSPGGERLLVFGREDEGADWKAAGSLRDVDPAAPSCTPLAMPGLKPFVYQSQWEGVPIVSADWMGDDPIVLSQLVTAGKDDRRDWRRFAPSGPVTLTAAIASPPQKLLAVDGSGLLFANADGAWHIDRLGHARRLSARFGRGASAPQPAVGDRISYVATRQAFAWVTDGASVARMTAAGVEAPVTMPSGARLLVTTPDLVAYNESDGHGVVSLMLRQDGATRQLLQVNRGWADIAFSEPVAVPYTGTRGEALKAWLYLPPDLPAGAKAPLVVIPYTGLVYDTVPRAFVPGGQYPVLSPHVLTAAGYAVVVPSMPRDYSNHEPAAGLADQVLAAVDATLKVAPVDPQRLALWGHSFGGYTSLVIATQTDRFKSVIDADGKSDFISAYSTFIPAARSAPEDGASTSFTMGWTETGEGNLGVPPAKDIERYARNSPVFSADKITAPVLMIHGDLDFVPLAQSEEMFSALYRQRKDAVLVTLWGEGHTATSPANIRRMYDWILWWLDNTIGPGSAAGGGPGAQDSGPVARPGFDRDELDQVEGRGAP